MQIEGEKGLKRAQVVKHVDKSLARLQTDRIDLYQTHKDDPETPVDETLEALDRLVKAGKVRAIGASQYGPDRLVESLAASERMGLATYQTLQPEFNLYDRHAFERDLQPVAEKHELAVIPFFGIAKGFLSGKYRKLADIEGRRAKGPQEVLRGRPRHAHPRRARPGRGSRRRLAGAGRARVEHGAADDRGADRERDLDRTAGRPDGGGAG
jgi:aryl-alcohol dehydrogenase-like predicted oxidoreductase